MRRSFRICTRLFARIPSRYARSEWLNRLICTFSDRINDMACYQTPIGREDRLLCSHTASYFEAPNLSSQLLVIGSLCTQWECMGPANQLASDHWDLVLGSQKELCEPPQHKIFHKYDFYEVPNVSECQASFQTMFFGFRDSRPSTWSIILYWRRTKAYWPKALI